METPTNALILMKYLCLCMVHLRLECNKTSSRKAILEAGDAEIEDVDGSLNWLLMKIMVGNRSERIWFTIIPGGFKGYQEVLGMFKGVSRRFQGAQRRFKGFQVVPGEFQRVSWAFQGVSGAFLDAPDVPGDLRCVKGGLNAVKGGPKGFQGSQRLLR